MRTIKSWYVETGAIENAGLDREVRFPTQREAEQAMATLDATRDRNGREVTIEESELPPTTTFTEWNQG